MGRKVDAGGRKMMRWLGVVGEGGLRRQTFCEGGVAYLDDELNAK